MAFTLITLNLKNNSSKSPPLWVCCDLALLGLQISRRDWRRD